MPNVTPSPSKSSAHARTDVDDRYSKPAIFLHWTIVVLVALAYLAIEVRGPKGSQGREFWSAIHFWCGSLVLALAVVRLFWRLWNDGPAEIPTSRLQMFAARAAHLALYLFIFAQPLLGILTINAGGHPVQLPGLNFGITLIGTDDIARSLFKAAHEFIGNLFYAVIGLHALGAIFHHVVLRDRTLKRMI
ncbi:cytochrome b [Burkholderia pseudomallei]|uniref:cytochrome b n=1 Tax=Burkholderia pseudomallei TaxID=28450 RepID=UPI001AAE2BA9|nr:cytochrome b [Burkholderia pseudomallei]MBO2986446.1 cytochrome b [Burkholderia pseudomallei]MBO7918707.1 cytochrome b [Burkholderia pseudomallei]